jgi:hypothetical protein
MLAGYEDPEPQGYDRSSSFDYLESNVVDESARGNVYSDDPGVTPCTAVNCLRGHLGRAGSISMKRKTFETTERQWLIVDVYMLSIVEPVVLCTDCC